MRSIAENEVARRRKFAVSDLARLPDFLLDAEYESQPFEINADRGGGSGTAPASTEITSNAPLETPQNLIVYSQEVKFGPTGVQLVDVVIQFDEVDGTEDYEMRVTKI